MAHGQIQIMLIRFQGELYAAEMVLAESSQGNTVQDVAGVVAEQVKFPAGREIWIKKSGLGKMPQLKGGKTVGYQPVNGPVEPGKAVFLDYRR
jgi:hypothetical protein